MAVSLARRTLSTFYSDLFGNSVYLISVIPSRNVTHKRVKRSPKYIIPNVPVQAKLDALKSRGFTRNTIPYQPPADVVEKLAKYIQDIVGDHPQNERLSRDVKFKLLSGLSKEFSYVVPNSLLHKINTIDDVCQFYMTPVDTIVPYDKFKTMELPPNLHVIHDYHRFHPDTDSMFGGISAFPKSSTIISGLTTKKKYKGHDAGNPFNDI